VEVDETYLGNQDGLRGGRELGDRALVVAAVEVRGRVSGRVRLQMVPDASGPSLTGFVTTNVEPGATVITDGWQGYAPLSRLGYRHRPTTQGRPERAEVILPRIHRVFGNLKIWLRGTHHGVDNKHLPAYLDEFTFRFNRRRTPMAAFQSLVGLTGVHTPVTTRCCTIRSQPDNFLKSMPRRPLCVPCTRRRRARRESVAHALQAAIVWQLTHLRAPALSPGWAAARSLDVAERP
jgi:transposase-like protein